MATLYIRSAESVSTFSLNKRITTFGTSDSHDCLLRSKKIGLLFTLAQEEHGYCLYPESIRLCVNGKATTKSARLQNCDRIEWEDGAIVFIETPIAALSSDEPSYLQHLLNLSESLRAAEDSSTVNHAIHQLLQTLIEVSGAERGYILTEDERTGAWKLSAGGKAANLLAERQRLFSNTILREAIQNRKAVYVENIIGHSYSSAVSVMENRVFSVACFPLVLSGQIMGAVYLYTQSPGVSIRKNRLADIQLLATQAALLIATHSTLLGTRRENISLKAGQVEKSKLIFDQTKPQHPMWEIYKKIEKFAPSRLSLMIRGETGSGKEVVAQEIHRKSSVARGPYVAINCSAIPPTLLESTLFGHEKGAFTGADKTHKGKFQTAEGGTLLLDEIGDLSVDLQAKLLRVLQEEQIEPVGGHTPIKVQVRVLSATHRNLEEMVARGEFRQDLYYRLMGSSITLPSLRERKDDIVPLVDHFLKGSEKKISASAVEKLKRHSWPGNVRELEQVILRATLLAEGDTIDAGDIEFSILNAEASPESADFYESLESAQKAFTASYVQRVLDQFEGNRSKSAEHLHISERTLYRILADHEEKPASTDRTV